MNKNTNEVAINEETRDVYHAQHQRIVNDNKAMIRFLNMVQEEYFGLPENYFKTAKVLDAGCGDTAKLLIRFSEFGCTDLAGIDLGNEYISVASKNLIKHKVSANTFQLFSGSIDALPFEDESFDFVCCHGVLLHLASIEQAQRAFSELARVTRKDGYLYVVGGVYGGLVEFVLPTIRQYYQSNSEFKKLIDEVSPNNFKNLFDFVNKELESRGQTGIDLSFIEEMLDVDFCTTLQNLIQAPVRLALSKVFFENEFHKYDFEKPKRLRRYVTRDNIRKYLSPLHFNLNHPISKILYGDGNLEFISRKKS